MGNIGRIACVALPFLLTIGAIIAMLVAGLAGVADKSLYMFQVNTTDLSISPLSVRKILNVRSPEPQGFGLFHDVPSLINKEADDTSSKSTNITAADLGLFNLYDVGIWGYCYTPQNGSRECTKPQFNWATGALNTTTSGVNSLITSTGLNVTLPDGIMNAVQAFGTVSKWTQVVFIIAYVALGVELFFGAFANCSRAFSCVTFLVALVAMVAVCAAAALATATSVIVVGAVEGTAKFYGVKASFNTRFLAAVWIGAAFAIASGFFWLFTICCCKPDHTRKNRERGPSAEKLMSGPYQPLEVQHGGYPQQYPQQYPQSYGAPQRDLAYEPYSHARA
ncbi:SUR7/PalI family-domain-containing protein [Lasiosphaeria miniovina]|uniref:SUR7/PalI family-domain-containing protein n=1 Tax=Lasiosphaeria miniovina TaxID=1954250 RepID=A0AA40BHL8_9PEZI|nr:SUR7/PalI family-domain-containing protein [Lasiosphaeria miniovina]KAK0734409.1 SUR7/PalI family-domain-containing protein [Lasiosphaeria miniovina]